MKTELVFAPPADVVARLDAAWGQTLLDFEGVSFLAPRVLPARAYADVDASTRKVWCMLRAVYGLPTQEAIDWLRQFIGGRSAIEIGASHGVFGVELGIPATDSYVQTQPDVRAFMSVYQQPCVHYGQGVERLDAMAAVRKYRPQVVFGSWVTQRGDSGDACMYGVQEDHVLARSHVEAYVVYGCRAVHFKKGIRQQVPKGWTFRVVEHPGFLSRHDGPSIMMVWERSCK